MTQDKHLFEYLQANYDRFTASQKRIAIYVLENDQQAPFHTVDELARHCRVNPSTVVRFCRECGYNGYPEFQKALRRNLLDRLNRLDVSDNLSRPMLAALHTNDESDPVIASLQKDLNTLNKLISMIDVEAVHDFSRHVTRAKKRYFICSKGSHGVTHLFYYRLSNILPNTVFLHDFDGTMYDNLIDFESEDVLIAINGARYTSRTVKFAQYVYDRRLCPIVSITDSKASPLFPISEKCLFYPSVPISYTRSRVGLVALINCILSTVISENMEYGRARLDRYEDIFDYFGIIHQDK